MTLTTLTAAMAAGGSAYALVAARLCIEDARTTPSCRAADRRGYLADAGAYRREAARLLTLEQHPHLRGTAWRDVDWNAANDPRRLDRPESARIYDTAR